MSPDTTGEDAYTELVREEFYREPRVGDQKVLRRFSARDDGHPDSLDVN